jgi:hypothetical protein
MSREVLALKGERERFEYTYTRISYPTDHLVIKIVFPPDFIPDEPAFDVWYGEGRVRHEREYGRIAPGFLSRWDSNKRLYLRLEVEYPLLGLTYLLRWHPPLAR